MNMINNGLTYYQSLDRVTDIIGKEVVSNLRISANICKDNDPVMSRFYEGYAATLASKLVLQQEQRDNPILSRRDKRKLKRMRYNRNTTPDFDDGDFSED